MDLAGVTNGSEHINPLEFRDAPSSTDGFQALLHVHERRRPVPGPGLSQIGEIPALDRLNNGLRGGLRQKTNAA
jgi:hypothetical protein